MSATLPANTQSPPASYSLSCAEGREDELFPMSRLQRFPGLRMILLGLDLEFALLCLTVGPAALIVASLTGVTAGSVMRDSDVARYVFMVVWIPICAISVMAMATGFLVLTIGLAYLACWFALTIVRRARYRRILRTQGWPNVLLCPALTRFSDQAWRRLPVYEDFLITGWCDRWFEGAVPPLNLFAALAFLEECEIERRDSYDEELPPIERTDEVAAALMRKPRRRRTRGTGDHAQK